MFLRLLDRLEEVLIAFLIAAATTIIFLAVCQRYGLSLSIKLVGVANAWGFEAVVPSIKGFYKWLASFSMTWAQELCIYLFVWMAKFGAAYGVRQGIHVGVDVLVNKLPEGPRAKLVVISLLAGALFTAIVGSLGANFVWHMAHTDQTSADLEVPMWLVYLCVPLGSYLMCFRFLQVAVNFIRTGDLPHHDQGHVDGLEDVSEARS
jgi:C4-dicarboxylate transporter, DctQ subunit